MDRIKINNVLNDMCDILEAEYEELGSNITERDSKIMTTCMELMTYVKLMNSEIELLKKKVTE